MRRAPVGVLRASQLVLFGQRVVPLLDNHEHTTVRRLPLVLELLVGGALPLVIRQILAGEQVSILVGVETVIVDGPRASWRSTRRSGMPPFKPQ